MLRTHQNPFCITDWNRQTETCLLVDHSQHASCCLKDPRHPGSSESRHGKFQENEHWWKWQFKTQASPEQNGTFILQLCFPSSWRTCMYDIGKLEVSTSWIYPTHSSITNSQSTKGTQNRGPQRTWQRAWTVWCKINSCIKCSRHWW